jgi:hypothetical protein
MATRRVPGLILLAFLATLATSSTARAWTRSVVGGAQARVHLRPDASALVLLRLDVEVQAGWLQALELAGLGANVVLDRSHPPYFRSEEGEIYRPEAEVDSEGRIHLAFSRRDAPKRGEYRAFIQYQTTVEATLVEAEGRARARVVWSLPAWETGLHGVSVELVAPKGASFPADSVEAPPGVDLRVSERSDATVFHWRRIHLPRMTPWPLTVDVPPESFALPTAAPEAPAPTGFRPLTEDAPRPFAWTLLAVAILALLKRRSIELTLGPRFLLIRAPWALVLTATAAVLAVGQWMDPQEVAWALPLVVLPLHRPVSIAQVTGQDEPWRPVRLEELPRQTTIVPDFLDCTTGMGLGVLLLGSAALLAAGQPDGALVLLPTLSCGTRRHAPPLPGEAVRLLRRFVSELRLPITGPQFALGWEMESRGRPRLRLHLAQHRAGLCGLSVVVASSKTGLLMHRRIMLMVETRAQSEADDLVRRRLPGLPGEAELRKPGGVIARLINWNTEALELVRLLGLRASKPVETSRGTWLLREISEPSRKAA